jgi:hypothetical protein
MSLAALLASCAPRLQPPQPTAPPPPAPAHAPAITPPPPPPADWQGAPLSPGDWAYAPDDGRGSATFASAGGPALIVRCDAPGRLSLIRAGTGGSRITIRTSFGERSLTALPVGNGLRATMPASDPLFDQIAFSRGRFLVETDGVPALIVPAWPEPARVVEDCRA